MKVFNKLPNYTRLDYQLNNTTGWYQLINCSKDNFKHLPDELKPEPSNQPFLIQQGARECIKGRQKDYDKFFTGLRITEHSGLFTGDNFKDKPSIIFFQFNTDKTLLVVYYINGYKVFSSRLKSFITDFKRRVIDLDN